MEQVVGVLVPDTLGTLVRRWNVGDDCFGTEAADGLSFVPYVQVIVEEVTQEINRILELYRKHTRYVIPILRLRSVRTCAHTTRVQLVRACILKS